jgi:hypothetical protein
MTLLEKYAGTNGTWGTEYSLTGSTASIQAQTADGLYAPWIDMSALARGDLYRLRAYEKVESGGTQREVEEWNIRHQQTAPLITIPPLMLLHGWDFTLQRLAGTDRTITWSVKGVEGGITEAFTSTSTIGTTEHFLASNSTSKTKQTVAGIYMVFLDVSAVAKGDDFLFTCTEEARAADTVEQAVFKRLIRWGGSPHYVSEALHLSNGWEFSLDKIAGTDRAIGRSIRKAA